VRSTSIAVCAIIVSACGNSQGYDPPVESAQTGATGASCMIDAPQPTYESFAQDFFASYCTRCHDSALEGSARNGAPPERNFDTLEAVRMNDPTDLDRVAAAGPERTNTFMPPSEPRPSESERMTLGTWLACGME
jgi:hypothetical protein